MWYVARWTLPAFLGCLIFAACSPSIQAVALHLSTEIPVPHSPVLDLIGNRTAENNHLLTFDVTATDVDGDTLSFSVSGQPAASTFEAVDAATYRFSWTPDLFDVGATLSLTFSVEDGLGGMDTETIVIGPVALDPVIANGDMEAEFGAEWVAVGSTLSRSTADVHNGSYSLEHIGSGTGSSMTKGARFYQDVVTKRNTNYTVSLWGKGGIVHYVYAGIESNYDSYGHNFVFNSGAWKSVSYTFTTTNDAAGELTRFSGVAYYDDSTTYFDDFTLVENP